MTSLSALLCLILIQSFPSAAHKKARILRALRLALSPSPASMPPDFPVSAPGIPHSSPVRFVRGKARIEVQASAPDANTMPQALTLWCPWMARHRL